MSMVNNSFPPAELIVSSANGSFWDKADLFIKVALEVTVSAKILSGFPSSLSDWPELFDNPEEEYFLEDGLRK
jgi:hypothetical protein